MSYNLTSPTFYLKNKFLKLQRFFAQSDLVVYFKNSFLFATTCLLTGFLYSFYKEPSIGAAFQSCFLILVLAALEVSLSFDNAVVNAKQLEKMSDIWKKRFLTWGIAIAVFGMRFFIPLALVSLLGGLSLIESLLLAFNNPHKYKEILESSHVLIAAFGGSFLLAVALNFFIDREKEHHWFHSIEARLQKLGSMNSIVLISSLAIGIVLQSVLPLQDRLSFITWYIYGLLTYEAIGVLHKLISPRDSEQEAVTLQSTVVKQGFIGFLYLEVLDISFSLDSLIGSLALSSDIVIIMLGLGIGSFFVRSLTIYLLEKKVLSQFKYLEHGAFYSIFSLSAILLLGLFIHIPELVTGLLAISMIGVAVYSSIKDKE